MRSKLFLAASALALLAAGLTFTGIAAGGKAARGGVYSFHGKLTATPAGGKISITVEGGNRPALRAMIGQPAAQTFAYGADTKFIRRSQGSIPAVVQPGDLHAGDYVAVDVRANGDASLAEIKATAAALVADFGATAPSRPAQPLYLFRGTLTAVGSAGISLNVQGGNKRALRLLIGQAAGQTFKVGSATVFVHLEKGKAPTAITLGDLKLGDQIAVRIRADAGSTLAQVEATAAVAVADRAPKA